MQNLETLTVGLTPQMAAEVRKAVENGEYASAGEVLRDALRAWSAARRASKDDASRGRDWKD